MGFVEAEREQIRGQIAIIGPSGSGKTVGALKLAYGMTGDWKKIGVVDTEHDRSKVYVGTTHTGGTKIGKFMHMKLEPPYETEKFRDAVNEAVEAGLEVVIIDSFSHEWEGVGGITDWASKLGGEFKDYRVPKMAHKTLIDEMMHSPINIIVTIRTKQEYVVVPGGGRNGKSSVEKLGMKPVQSGDIDYEFLVAFTINTDNTAEATKDNTALFKGMNDLITEDHGRMLKEWLADGKEVESVESQNKVKEERRQELVAKFAEKEKQREDFLKYFTKKEIEMTAHYKNCPLEVLEEMNKEVDKYEKEHQELVEYFTEARNATDKSRAFYDKLEAEKGKIHEWPLAYMKGLYKKLKDAEARQQSQQPAPAQEEPAPTPPPEEPKVEDNDTISKILSNIAFDPKVEKVAEEFMKKMKIESVHNASADQTKMLLMLTDRKVKTVKEERETA